MGSAKDGDGLHEGSGEAFGDGEQVARAGEDLDHGRVGELRQVDLHAIADVASGLFVHGDRGHLGEQGAGMGEAGFDLGGGEALEVVDGDGLIEGEDSGAGTAEGGKMSAAVGELPKFMGDRADVASGGDFHLEVCAVAFEAGEGEAVDGDAGGFDGDVLPCPGQLVGRNAVNLLGGEDGWSLQHPAVEAGGEGAELFEVAA